MKYSDLKFNIEEKMIELAKLIEQFCVIDNKEYLQYYQNELKELHTKLEDIIKN